MNLEKINLPSPLKYKEGITKWQEKEYNKNVKLCCRIYPQDNDTDGFFISKLRKVK